MYYCIAVPIDMLHNRLNNLLHTRFVLDKNGVTAYHTTKDFIDLLRSPH